MSREPPIIGYERDVLQYQQPSPALVELLQDIKRQEWAVLTMLDGIQYAPLDGADINERRRWAAIARTNIQQGFMAMTRATVQPKPPEVGHASDCAVHNAPAYKPSHTAICKCAVCMDGDAVSAVIGGSS